MCFDDQVTDLDHWGVVTALAGMRGAYDRYGQAHREPIPVHEEAATAVVDFVNCACSLDELLGGTDSPRTEYAVRRDGDEAGRVLPALRFVRDRHMHQAAMAPGMKFLLTGYVGQPPHAMTGASIYWRDLADIRQPTDWRNSQAAYRQRRDAYIELLEGHDPIAALTAALHFLSLEVAARGILLPPDD